MCALLLGMNRCFAYLFAKILSSIMPGYMPVGAMKSFTVVCLVSNWFANPEDCHKCCAGILPRVVSSRPNEHRRLKMAIRTWLSKQPCFFECWFAKVSFSFLHGLDFAVYCCTCLLEWNKQLRTCLGISAFHSCNCHVTHIRFKAHHLPHKKTGQKKTFFSPKKDWRGPCFFFLTDGITYPH